MWGMLAVLLETEDETKLSPREREKILLFWSYFILSFWNVDLCQQQQNYIFADDVAGI